MRLKHFTEIKLRGHFLGQSLSFGSDFDRNYDGTDRIYTHWSGFSTDPGDASVYSSPAGSQQGTSHIYMLGTAVYNDAIILDMPFVTDSIDRSSESPTDPDTGVTKVWPVFNASDGVTSYGGGLYSLGNENDPVEQINASASAAQVTVKDVVPDGSTTWFLCAIAFGGLAGLKRCLGPL
jgi:hypothetical protein